MRKSLDRLKTHRKYKLKEGENVDELDAQISELRKEWWREFWREADAMLPWFLLAFLLLVLLVFFANKQGQNDVKKQAIIIEKIDFNNK